MTWTKIDDQFHSHPKVRKVWHACKPAVGLHLLALSHSGAYLTDGCVSEEFATDQLPATAERRKAISALVDAGVWDVNPEGGWVIHDYLKYNESREQILARRHADSARKGGGRRGES